MRDLLATATAWLHDQRAQHMARTVTYARGAETVDLPATRGKTEFDVLDNTGAPVRFTSVDFLITAADLVLGGAATLPRTGDRVTDPTDGAVFQVITPDGAQPYRVDPYGVGLRVHTKRVA